METIIVPILFLIGIAFAAVLLLKLFRWIKEKALDKVAEELAPDVKKELISKPTFTLFQDDTRKEIQRKNMKKGIIIILLFIVIGLGISIIKDVSFAVVMIVVAVFAFVIFLLLIKDCFVYGGKELYEVRAYCDYRIYGRYNTARVFYYNFNTMMIEGNIKQNISVGRELKAGQFCYVIVKSRKNKLVIVDISPRKYVKGISSNEYIDYMCMR